MRYDYAWQKLYEGMQKLVGDETLRHRLREALGCVNALRIPKLPSEIQGKLQELDIEVDGLSNDDLHAYAYKFLDLYDEVTQAYGAETHLTDKQ